MGKAKKRNTARKTTGNHPFPPKDRTKQTAEKSTGAPAPHTILSSKSSKAGRKMLIISTVLAADNCTCDDVGEVPMEVDPKEDSPAADTNEGATAPADMGEEPGDQELGTILPGTGAILTGTNEVCPHGIHISRVAHRLTGFASGVANVKMEAPCTCARTAPGSFVIDALSGPLTPQKAHLSIASTAITMTAKLECARALPHTW